MLSYLTEELATVISAPNHSIGIIGHSGKQLEDALDYILKNVLTDTKDIRQNKSILIVEPDKRNSIGVEQIRSINHFLSLQSVDASSTKTIGIKRSVVIMPADSMTIEAQNSLLKNLEEPPIDTMFVLGIVSKNKLIPTVISRLQLHNLSKASNSEIRNIVESDPMPFNDDQINKAILISNGLPDDVTDILNDTGHPRYMASDTAKTILTSAKFERLILADKIAKQKELAELTLELMIKISEYSIAQQIGDSKYWLKVISEVTRTQNDLAKNAQTKLALTRLMLSI